MFLCVVDRLLAHRGGLFVITQLQVEAGQVVIIALHRTDVRLGFFLVVFEEGEEARHGVARFLEIVHPLTGTFPGSLDGLFGVLLVFLFLRGLFSGFVLDLFLLLGGEIHHSGDFLIDRLDPVDG